MQTNQPMDKVIIGTFFIVNDPCNKFQALSIRTCTGQWLFEIAALSLTLKGETLLCKH